MALFDMEEFRKWKREYEAAAQREREEQRLAEENEATASKKTKKLNHRQYNQFDKRRLFCKKIKELLANVPDDSLENVFDEVKALMERHSK